MKERSLPEHYRKDAHAQGYIRRRFSSAGGLALQEIELKAFSELLGKGPYSRILELACGTGRLTRLLNERFPHSLIGVDASLAMIREIGSGVRVPIACADIFDLPFKPGSFDACISLRLFHHFTPAKIALALAAVRRVLSPGGVLIFNTTKACSLAAAGAWTNMLRDKFAYQHFISDKAVRRILLGEGFSVAEKKDVLFMPSFAFRLAKTPPLASAVRALDRAGQAFAPGACSMTVWKAVCTPQQGSAR